MAIVGARAEELARSAAADPAAMEELLREIRPGVLQLCARFLPFRDDAEDACQETLLAVSQDLPTWQGRSAFGTWLYRVTANQARSTYRTLRRRATTSMEHAGDRPDPRRTSVTAGIRIDLLEGLDALGPELAEAVTLRDVLELEYREIAVLLGVAEGTVKSRIHEGRRRLRGHLAG